MKKVLSVLVAVAALLIGAEMVSARGFLCRVFHRVTHPFERMRNGSASCSAGAVQVQSYDATARTVYSTGGTVMWSSCSGGSCSIPGTGGFVPAGVVGSPFGNCANGSCTLPGAPVQISPAPTGQQIPGGVIVPGK